MKLRFWGVRGSSPVAIQPDIIRQKIVSVVNRIRPSDLESNETRFKFLTALPEWLYGTVGGNTPCLEVVLDETKSIIFDAGSGIVPFGDDWFKRPHKSKDIHIFFTHFHYDHIQGFPFFGPAYDPTVHLHFYSPVKNLEEMLRGQMRHPYFPITMEGRMTQNVSFTVLPDEPIDLYGVRIRWRKLNHPGGAYGYRIEGKDRIFGYISDTELLPEDYQMSDTNVSFFKGIQTMVLDTPYTLGEAIEKYNWGHTSFTHGVEFAHTWGIEVLFLFHHEPRYDDQRLHLNLQSARWYAKSLGNTKLSIYLSMEGREFQI